MARRRVAAERLKQRVPRRDPFQVCSSAVSRSVEQRGYLQPGREDASQASRSYLRGRSASGPVESVREAGTGLRSRPTVCRLADEPGDRLGTTRRSWARALGARSAFRGSVSWRPALPVRSGRWRGTGPRRRCAGAAPRGRHLRAFLRSSPGAPARHGPREHLAHDVEDRVVIEGVADLLELLQEPPEDVPSIVLVATKLKIRQSFAGRSGGCGPSAAPAGSGSRGCRS